MQGIETLGYEVVEQPIVQAMGFPEGGIAEYKKAADMLADFGRNGDTYIVHAAKGETVLPMEVLDQNPRLKNMIFKQMEEMGLEPERYIVGNELNSLNPDTGQPEFFFAWVAKTLKKAVKSVVKIVKKIAPVVLPMVAPFLLPTMPIALASGLGSFAGNLIQGKSIGDSLKEGLKTGVFAGGANLLAGGSFLGSVTDKANKAGLQSLKTMFTPDNPFTSAAPQAIQAVRDKVASVPVSSAGFREDRVLPPSETQPKTFFEGARSALTPGDDYGVGDFYSQYLSPSRPSISADANQAGVDAVNAFKLANPDATPSMLDRVFDTAVKQATPSMLQQYGPLAATALGGAALSDSVLGTNLLTGQEEKRIDREGIMNEGADLLASDPDKYGIGSGLYAGNKYYDQRVNPVEVGSTEVSDINFIPSYNPDPNLTAQTSNPYFAAMNAPLANTGATGPSGPQGQYGVNTGFAQNLFNPPPDLVANPFMTYAKSGGEIVGPGTPTSDSIPAMLSDGEFVMNARAVKGAGAGDRKQGAKRMYEMMRKFERSA
jgi:hypothetical protein